MLMIYNKLFTIILIICTLFCVSSINKATAANSADEVRQTIYNEKDKRKNIRICTSKLEKPIIIKSAGNTLNVTDISLGGLGLKSDGNIKENEIIPVTICYNNVTADVSLKIVFSDKEKAGGEFVMSDRENANKLLLIGIMLEADNGLLITDFRGT